MRRCRAGAVRLGLLAFSMLWATAAPAATYYAATTGDDVSGDGSEANPWATVKFGAAQLQAGDTLLVRAGMYRETTVTFANSGTGAAPITVKAAPGEAVVLSGAIDASDPLLWEPATDVMSMPVPGVWKYIGSPDCFYNVTVDLDSFQMAQDALGLAYDGLAEHITGPGFWTRSRETGCIDAFAWVQVQGGGNPGLTNIELSRAARVIDIVDGIDHIVLEDLTIENANDPVRVSGDYFTGRRLTLRNSFQDGLKINGSNGVNDLQSVHGLLENSDIYHFGENGVDITGGDFWTVRNCSIHDGVPIRDPDPSRHPDGYRTNGVSAKNESIRILVEGNRFYDLRTRFAVVAIGGNSNVSGKPVVREMIVRNNLFDNVVAPSVVNFIGALNSKFVNNVVVNSDVTASGLTNANETLVQFSEGFVNDTDPKESIESLNNEVSNNVFWNNTATYNYRERIVNCVQSPPTPCDNDTGTTIDHNVVEDRQSEFDTNLYADPAALLAGKGYSAASDTGAPAFVSAPDGLYRLASISLGANTGVDLAEAPYDFLGLSRPQGASTDRGIYENPELPTGLEDVLGWWPLEEGRGTMTEDASGNGRHGALLNLPTTTPRDTPWQAALRGKGLRFGAAAGSEVQIAAPTASFAQGLSVSLWARFDSIDPSENLKALVSGLTGEVRTRLFQRTGTFLELQWEVDGSLQNLFTTPGTLEAGAWTHLAATLDPVAGEARVYVNGALDTTDPLGGSVLDTGPDPMRIGGDGQIVHDFNGAIEGVRVYGRPLSASEVGELASETSFLPEPGGVLPLVLGGAFLVTLRRRRRA